MIKVVSEEERARRLRIASRCAARHANGTPKRNPNGMIREAEIIALAAIGESDEEIAARLGLQPHTPGTYWKRALEKAGARTRTELVSTVLLMEIARLQAMVVQLRKGEGANTDSPLEE